MAIEDIGGEIYSLKIGVDKQYSNQQIRELLQQAQREMSGSRNAIKIQVQPDARSLKDFKNLDLSKLAPSSPVKYDFGLESQRDFLNDLITTGKKDLPNAVKNMSKQLNTVMSSTLGGVFGASPDVDLKSYAKKLLGENFNKMSSNRVNSVLSNISNILNERSVDFSKLNFTQMMQRLSKVYNAQGFLRELKNDKNYSSFYSDDLYKELSTLKTTTTNNISRQVIQNTGKLQVSIANAINRQEDAVKTAVENHMHRMQSTLAELEAETAMSQARLDKINAQIGTSKAKNNTLINKSAVKSYIETSDSTRSFWKEAHKTGYDKKLASWAKQVEQMEQSNPEALYDKEGNYSIKLPTKGVPNVSKSQVLQANAESLREYIETAAVDRHEVRKFIQSVKQSVRAGQTLSQEDKQMYNQLANLPGLKKGEWVSLNKLQPLKVLKTSQEQMLSAYNEILEFRRSGQEIARNRQFSALKYRTLDGRYKISSIGKQNGQYVAETSKAVAGTTATQTASVSKEIQSLTALEQKLGSITQLVDGKTQAFRNEEAAVAQVVSNEINTLTGLETKIDTISNKAKDLGTNLSTNIATATDAIEKAAAASKSEVAKTPSTKDTTGKSEKSDTTSVYNQSDLNKSGQLYLTRLYNTMSDEDLTNKITGRLKAWGNNNGIAFSNIDVQSVRDMEGNLRAFNITAKDSTNVIRKFSLEKAKIVEGSGKGRTGFVLKGNRAIVTTSKDDTGTKSTGSKKDVEKPVSQKDIKGVKELNSAYKQLFKSVIKQKQAYSDVKNLLHGKGGIEEQKALVYAQKGFDSKKFEAGLKDSVKGQIAKYTGGLKEKVAGFQSKIDTKQVANIDLYTQKLNQLRSLIQQIESLTVDGIINGTEKDISELNTLQAKVGSIVSSLGKDKMFKPINEISRNKSIAKVSDWLEKNTGAAKSTIRQVEGIRSAMHTANNDADLSKLNTQFLTITNSAQAAGQAGASMMSLWKSRLKTLLPYLLSYQSFYRLIAIFRQGINTIKEYNSIMTEMRMVSNESKASLEEYRNETFDLGRAIGTSAKDIQKSTTEWLRLGEAMDEAKKSAEASSVLFNISEFENINEATEGLISTAQAYQNVDKMDIVDKISYVGNNYAIATEGLTEAMKRSAAALSTQGNDIDKTIALLTAGNTVIQDPEKVGTAMTTISLRIAGTEEAKGELESLGEEVEDYVVKTSSKTDDIIKKYTAVESNNFKGVSVLDENGNLKDTYDILLAISKIYKEIQDEDKKQGTNRANALVEELAGKKQANIVASILANPDVLESVYEGSKTESEGYGEKTNEEHLDSIEAQFNRLKNSADEFWQKFISSDIVKGVTKFLNFFVQGENFILNLQGAIPQILTLIAAVKGFKGGGLFRYNFEQGKYQRQHWSGMLTGGLFNPYNFFVDKFMPSDRLKAIIGGYTNRINSGSLSGQSANLIFRDKLQKYGNHMGLSNRDLNIVKEYNNELIRTGKSMNELPLERYVQQTHGIGYGATKASAAFKALKTAAKSFGAALASAFWQAAVMFVIGQVISKISDLILTTKEAKQALDEFNDSFKELNNTITEGKKKLPDLEKTYWELADGVDALGNNISLTESQYDTYLDTVKNIYEIMPSLSTYFNEQGDAIGFAKSQMYDLNAEYKQYEQNQIHDRWFTEEDDGRTKAEKAVKGINADLDEVEIEKKVNEILSELEKYDTLSEKITYIKRLYSDTSLSGGGATYDALKQIVEEAGLNESQILNGVSTGYITYKEKKYSLEDVPDNVSSEIINGFRRSKSTKARDDNNVNIRNLMTAYAKDSDGYATMSGTESEDLVNFINSFDFASMFADYGDMTEEDYKGLAAQIIKGVKTEGFSEAFHNLLDENKISAMSYEEAEKFVDENLDVVAKAFNWNKDSEEYLNFKATLGFDTNDTELFEKVTKKTDLSEEQLRELFTKGEIQLIANVDFVVSKDSKGNVDKIKEDAKQYAEVKAAHSSLQTSDTALKSSLKTIENYGIHYGKIVEMVNGTRFITDPAELNELLEALPELQKHLKYTESGWMLEAEAMDGVQKSVFTLQQAYVDAQQVLTSTAVQDAMTRMKINSSELANITSIVDAYKLLSTKIKGGITFNANGTLDTTGMSTDEKLIADGLLAQARLSKASEVMKKTAKLASESSKEDRKKQIKDLKDQQHLADLQYKLEKISQTLKEFTKQLENLKKAQDDLFENDYIGKLDYINQRYEVQNSYVKEAQTNLDEMLNIQPQTAQGWEELATNVENLSSELFEGKRALIDYQVELAQTYMDALKISGEISSNVLKESNELYQRNLKLLTEGGLGGLQFSLTPLTPESAIEKQRKENKELAKEEEVYQKKVNEIKQRALDEMKAYEDKQRADQLADLTSEAYNAMASLNEEFWKAMNMGWKELKELIEAEGLDININWSGIGSESDAKAKEFWAEQNGVTIVKNPKRGKNDTGTGWQYKTADGKTFETVEGASAHNKELIVQGNKNAIGTRTQLGKDLGLTVGKAKDGTNEYYLKLKNGDTTTYDSLLDMKESLENVDNDSDSALKQLYCNYYGVVIDKTNPDNWKYIFAGQTKENIEDIRPLVNKRLSAVKTKAKGGTATGDIIVNEEGQESYLGKDGKLHLFKPGAQFFNTDEVVRVFNAEDTKKIRKYTGDKYFNEPVGDLSKVTQLANGNMNAIFPTILPENAANAIGNDSIGEAVEDATEEHYDRLSDIQNDALNEEISLNKQTQDITEIQKEQHYDDLELAQKTTNALTSQEQVSDNSEKLIEEKRFTSETENVVTELLNWMKNNPIKAPGLDSESWEQMILDAQGYLNQLTISGYGTGGASLTNRTYGTGRDAFVKLLESQVGYKTSSENKNMFSDYGNGKWHTNGDTQAWCADFLSWAITEAGLDDIIKTSSSAAGLTSGLKKTTKPIAGDIAVFVKNGKVSHVEGVVGIDSSGNPILVGGNTGNDEVKRRSRSDVAYYVTYASGTKDYGIAGENYRKEYLIDKKTGKWTEVNSPTLIDTNEVDVVGEKASAKINKPLPMYALGTNPHDRGKAFINAAGKYMGTPYVYGGKNKQRDGGLDCSGLIYNAFKDVGLNYGIQNAQGYRNYGAHVNGLSSAIMGDLLFFGKNNYASHVGFNLDQDFMLHSSGGSNNTRSNPGKGVSYKSIHSRSDLLEVRRYAKGTKHYGVAGENYKTEFLIDKKTGEWEEINSPTLIDTNEVDVVGEKDSALIGKSFPMYANGTLGNMNISSELPKLTVEQIQTILSTNFANSKLNVSGAAEGIFNAQQSSGVSALAMLAIAAQESGWDSSSAIAQDKNNYWGWNHYSANGKSAYERSTTFSSDIGTAFATYGDKLKTEKYSTESIMEMAARYNDASWGDAVSKHMDTIVNTLNNAGLGDMSANLATTAANTTQLVRRSLDQQVKDLINGSWNSENSEGYEDALMQFIKSNVQISDEHTQNYINAFKTFSDNQNTFNKGYEVLYQKLIDSVGTSDFDAVQQELINYSRDHVDEIMSASTDMTVAYAKSQYDLISNVYDLAVVYYNKRLSEGATADELKVIAEGITIFDTQKSEISDNYNNAIQAETDRRVAQANRDIKKFTDRESWFNDENEDDPVKSYENTLKRNDINKEKSLYANSQFDELLKNDKFSSVLKAVNYDISDWFDANGELSANFEEWIATIAPAKLTSEDVALAKQLASEGSVWRKAAIEGNEAIKDTSKTMANLKIEKYTKYQERLVETLNFDSTISAAMSTAKKGMYDIFKMLRDETAEMEKELKANMQIDDWLTEDTRKLLFNTEDFEEQMNVINDIESEANSLYIKYQNDLASLKEDELYKEEEITAEYNRQLAKLQDRLAIAKADLQLAKDKSAFENALRERDTQIIMGNRVQNVADPEKLREAAMKMAESESKLTNETLTVNENQDIRNMEAATGLINQERAAIENRIEMINGMTEAERLALADFLEPIQIIDAKLNAISKTNPERIIRGDNSNDVLTNLDLTKRDGWSLGANHSGMVTMFQNLLDNGYYKKNSADYEMVSQLIEWLKWQHDSKTTNDAHNYGYSLYNSDNAYLWGKGALKMYSDDVFRTQSQHWEPIEDYIGGLIGKRQNELLDKMPVISGEGEFEVINGTYKKATVVSGEGNIILADGTILEGESLTDFVEGYNNNLRQNKTLYSSLMDEGYTEISLAELITPYIDDPYMANAIAKNLMVGNIAGAPDMYTDVLGGLSFADIMRNGNTDNSVHMENVNVTIEKPIQNADVFVNELVRKTSAEYSTTSNQR